MLDPGFRFGAYEVIAPLGIGGMGEVYRARDPKLNREVAIKVLPDLFAHDPDRLARFEREAQALAALNHTNIAQVYGIEGGALVMELVEGEDLAQRIARGAVPVDEALAIVRQIAAALEAAHDRGIVHRDLKPANVKVRPDGAVKVLDFGLAKLGAIDASGVVTTSPTFTSPALMTQAGVIIGTAAYMAPEQAKGKAVDKRADLWALGLVLYEMLTGRAAFDGETITDVLAAVVTRDPDWSALPPNTPAAVKRLLARCLQRDPKRRLGDAGEAAYQLDEAIAGQDASAFVAPAARSTPRQRLFTLLPWGLAAAFAVAVATLILAQRNRAVPPSPSARLTIALPPGQELTSYPAITRDGRTIAYAAREGLDDSQLYLRDLTSFDARVVPGSSGAKQPFFSPDGRWIAFFAQGQLQKAEVGGGTAVRIADAASPMGGTWTADNHIVYTSSLNSGLLRVAASGGATEIVSKPDGGARGYAHVFPHALPGSTSLAFTVWGQAQGVAVLPLTPGGGDWSLVLPLQSFSGGVFASSGGPEGRFFVVTPDAEVKAGAFNAARPAQVNADVSVLSGVYFEPETESEPWLAVSATETAVYAAASPAKTSLVWVDHDGKIEPLGLGQDVYREVRLSPDGSKAVVRHSVELWVHDLQRRTSSRLTSGKSNLWPSWSPDGKRVIFASNRGGDWDIYSQPADGSVPAEALLKRRFDQFPLSVAADGTIIYAEIHPETARDLWTLSVDGKTAPLRVSPSNETAGQFAPNVGGSPHWLTYTSDESGRYEVYVQSYPDGGNRIPVSSGGGISPHWSRDGRHLFYVSGDSVMAVSVGPDGSVGAARRLFDRSDYHFRFNVNGWDTSADGKRFLLIHRDAGSVPRQLNVILNWLTDLNRAAPVSR